ncbi:ABC transporter permease [Propionibacteriaceae bacterium Y1700]|uniref:ABC transporter permease n=1 Tax=Microlunatus sp. Y1700 TaxID=3418487 RepID=UPI003DA6D24E
MNLFSYLNDPANWGGADGIAARIGQHLTYTGLSLLIAAVIAIVLGVLIGHFRVGQFLVVGVSNAGRAIPTLGLLVLVVTLMGSGVAPVLLALTVLAVPPILNATATGVSEADPGAVQASRAMGMNAWQMITQVELPLALPLIVSGLRNATLQVVSTATVAALAAAGGLGRLVVDGQRSGENGYPQMFAGAILVAAIAVTLDVLLGLMAFGLRRRRSRTRDDVSDEGRTITKDRVSSPDATAEPRSA